MEAHRRKFRRISRLRRHRGVILVLVLLLLTLCGAITGQMGSRIIRLGGQAARAQRELQQRWAIVSLRRTCLGNAPAILTEGSQGLNVQRRSMQFLISGERYEVSLEDESSKLPVQRMLRNAPIEQVKPWIRDLVSSSEPLQTTWGSEPYNLAELFPRPAGLTHTQSLHRWNRIADKITLWSDGKLNASTCDARTLDALWHFRFGRPAPTALHEARAYGAGNALSDWMTRKGVDPKEAEFASLWLGPTATTYSLWLSCIKENGDGFTAIYVRRASPGFADEQFGFHYP